jgi:hypothetical protein
MNSPQEKMSRRGCHCFKEDERWLFSWFHMAPRRIYTPLCINIIYACTSLVEKALFFHPHHHKKCAYSKVLLCPCVRDASWKIRTFHVSRSSGSTRAKSARMKRAAAAKICGRVVQTHITHSLHLGVCNLLCIKMQIDVSGKLWPTSNTHRVCYC